MPETAATVRATAEQYRARAEVATGDTRASYTAMAEWWEQRAAELEEEEE